MRKIEVIDREYKFSHGHGPRGIGGWVTPMLVCADTAGSAIDCICGSPGRCINIDHDHLDCPAADLG